MKCMSCGAENSDAVKFCTSCGSKLEQTNEPKPESFTAAEIDEEPKPFEFPAKKIFGLVSGVLVIALAVALLAFVCLIGVSQVSIPYSGEASKTTLGIIELFGKYKGLIMGAGFTGIASAVTFPVTIVLVAVFSILALVGAIRNLLGKKETNGGKWIASAFLTYVVGATLIKSYFDIPSNFPKYVTAKMDFSGATVAGITICSLLFGAFIVFMLLSRGKELLDKKVITNGAFAIAKVVLAGVIIAMVASVAYKVDMNDAATEQGYLQLAITVAHWGMTESIFGNVINNGWIASIILLMPAVLSVVVSAFAAIVLRHNIRTFLSKDHKFSLVWNIVLVAVSLLLLIVSAVIGNLFAGYAASHVGTDSYSIVPIGPIVIFVLSLISLGVAIARVCVNNYLSKQPTAGESADEAAPKEEEEAV